MSTTAAPVAGVPAGGGVSSPGGSGADGVTGVKKPPRPAARSPRQASSEGGFRDMSFQHVGMDGASPFVPASMAEGRGKTQDRRVDNETRVRGEEDRLAFSKKGRPVQYT